MDLDFYACVMIPNSPCTPTKFHSMAEAEIQDRSCDHDRHFLVVAYGIQGHVNPARALARRLARVHGGPARVSVTLSVTVSGHGRMFPSLASPDEETSDGLISYVPYDDGLEFGGRPTSAEERARFRDDSVRSLSSVVSRLAAAGRPVTCVVSALSLPAADVAAEHGIPFVMYWIQPATALAAYYHYYHGHEQAVVERLAEPAYEVSLPGLRPLRIRDFPSFLVDATGSEHSKASVQWLRELLEFVGREKPKVLINTSDVLEAAAVEAMRPYLDVLAVGPMVPPPSPPLQQQTDAAAASEDRIHLYELREEKRYMEWLDARPARSVVYLSFGSMLSYTLQQVEEILLGLRDCGRPYLWVVRKDGRDEEVERRLVAAGSSNDQGMVVEWCEQLEVLAHAAVGCFVTHCGWNSTLEAVTLGVPMVAAPNWSDQPLNAHLVEDDWGVGVRAERDGEGVLAGAEMARCVETVMGGGDIAAEIRENVRSLKERVREGITEGGSAELRLRNFVEAMEKENLV